MKIPIHWRVLDAVEAVAAVLWPGTLHRFTGWLLMAPAIALVGLLAVAILVPESRS